MKHIYITPIFLAILLGLGSCNMDHFPSRSIARDQSLLSAKDAQKWSIGMYTKFRNRQRGMYNTIADKQADQLNASVSFGNRGGEEHGWENLLAGDGGLASIWFNYYGALKEPNDLLEKLPALRDAQQEEKDKEIISKVMGEAHMVRAFYYTELVNRFGERHNLSNASTALGVPLVLSFDVKLKPARSSVKEVYEQIFQDIEQAKVLLTGRAENKPMSPVFTPDCATALEARAALNLQDYERALRAAQTLISSGRYPLMAPTAENAHALWRLDTSKEIIMKMVVSRPDELPNGGGAYISPSQNDGSQSPDFLPTQWMIDLYNKDKDIRFPEFFAVAKLMIYEDLKIKDKLYYINKFRGNPELASITNNPIWGIVPNGMQAPKPFKISELYLIAAEAAYKLGKDALAYLNPLRQSRGLDALNGVAGDALWQEIKDERTRELAYEGFRLWDLRRWEMPMVRDKPQTVDGKSDFLSIPGYVGLSIPKDHPKFVWGIPSHDLKINSNIKQNPGW